MQDFGSILDNQILLVSVFACLLAQGLKVAIELLRHGKVTVRFFFSTGGMPSAHSALVGALATGVGQTVGWASPEFAIACLFATIVMYDAAGVRQAAGKQARILNQILDEFFQEGKQFDEERLKELLGHTPFQVFVGLILGIGTSWLAITTWL
jgi:acid phosphatase family membrane protein YuiD